MSRSEYLLEAGRPVVNRTVVAVSTVVVDDAGLVLMVRRRGAFGYRYALPGGPQYVGETVGAAARRWTSAATGVQVELSGLLGVYEAPSAAGPWEPAGGWPQEFGLCFRGRPIGGRLRARGETEVVWVEPEELAVLDVGRGARLRIEHGLRDRAAAYFG